MSKVKRTVKITEDDLVNLIDNIVAEAVDIKKKEWLAEQAQKGDKTAIFEQRIAQLETKIKNLK